MPSAMRSIFAALVELLEGRTGATVCKVAAETFVHSDVDVEALGPELAAAAPRPFSFGKVRLASTESELGDATSGTEMRASHQVELKVAYSDMPQQPLEALSCAMDDELILRQVLEYEPNVALTTDWTGCSVVDVEVRPGGEGTPPPLVVMVVTLEVSHRENRLP